MSTEVPLSELMIARRELGRQPLPGDIDEIAQQAIACFDFLIPDPNDPKPTTNRLSELLNSNQIIKSRSQREFGSLQLAGDFVIEKILKPLHTQSRVAYLDIDRLGFAITMDLAQGVGHIATAVHHATFTDREQAQSAERLVKFLGQRQRLTQDQRLAYFQDHLMYLQELCSLVTETGDAVLDYSVDDLVKSRMAIRDYHHPEIVIEGGKYSAKLIRAVQPIAAQLLSQGSNS